MTVATLPGGLIDYLPGLITGYGLAGITSFTSTATTLITFHAGTDVLALMTRVPKTGTVTGLEFRTGTVSTAGATFDLGLYTVDPATGLNTGTPYAANSNGTVAVATSDDNVFKAVAINSGTGVAVTRGDLVAMVLSVSSGTPNTVIVQGQTIGSMNGGVFPYQCRNTTGALAKASNQLCCPFVWNYGGTYEYSHGCNPTHTVTMTAAGNDNEIALRFQVPVPIRVNGMVVFLSNIAAGADYSCLLCDATGAILKQVDVDGDTTSPDTTNDAYAYVPFPTSQALTASTTYYASVWQRTANDFIIPRMNVISSAYMAAMPAGAQFYGATRTGGTGAFTDVNTARPMIHLMVDGLDDGAGGGGASLPIGPSRIIRND